jgi:hypothetical protein
VVKSGGGVFEVIEILPTIAMWLIYGMAGMFLVLAAICGLGAIIYPFYILFEGIRNKLL